MVDLSKAETLAVQAALNKMMAANYFSICDLDKIASVLGKKTGNQSYKILLCLHCVNYASMEPEMREMLPELIADALSIGPIDSAFLSKPQHKQAMVIDAAPERVSTGFLRLIG